MQKREDNDYVFDRFFLDTQERILRCEGKAVPITLKAFNTLSVLVQRSGHIVDKVELMNQVWPNAFVEEANLTQHIYKLRKILGLRADGCEYIETVPRRGYRFADVASISKRAGDIFVMETGADSFNGIGLNASAKSETTTILLAIVPSAVSAGDPDAECFSDCIAQSLSRLFSGLPELRIMSRKVVFAMTK